MVRITKSIPLKTQFTRQNKASPPSLGHKACIRLILGCRFDVIKGGRDHIQTIGP